MTSRLDAWESESIEDLNEGDAMVKCKWARTVCPLGQLGTETELRGQGLDCRVWQSLVEGLWIFE